MAQKTPVQELTSAVLRLHLDSFDKKAAADVQKWALVVGQAWTTTPKPPELTAARLALVNGWLGTAVVDPQEAAKDGPRAAAVLAALGATLDPLPLTVWQNFVDDLTVGKAIEEIATGMGLIVGKAVDAVTPSGSSFLWIGLGALGALYFLKRKGR